MSKQPYDTVVPEQLDDINFLDSSLQNCPYHAYQLLRGEPVKWAHHDPRPCQIPPDWSGGYSSIYAAQSKEDASGAM